MLWLKVVISTKTKWMHDALVLLFSAIVTGCASTTTVNQFQDPESIRPETIQDSKCESMIISTSERSEYENAIKEFLPSAEQGDANSQLMLGGIYYQNAAVSPNVKGQNLFEASTWYRRAAKQGLVEAQYNLALLYYHGRGVTKNHFLAEKWYTQAAKQGYVCAQYNLGRLYEFKTKFFKIYGVDVTKYKSDKSLSANTKKFLRAYIDAYMWYTIAASNNHKLAIKKRDKIEPKLTRAELDEAEMLAREWIELHQQPR